MLIQVDKWNYVPQKSLIGIQEFTRPDYSCFSIQKYSIRAYKMKVSGSWWARDNTNLTFHFNFWFPLNWKESLNLVNLFLDYNKSLIISRYDGIKRDTFWRWQADHFLGNMEWYWIFQMDEWWRFKGGLISEGVFNMIPSTKNKTKSLSLNRSRILPFWS